MKKAFLSILPFFIGISMIAFFLFSLTGCDRYSNRYSNSTNPQEYLEFELLEDDTYAVIGFSGRFIKNLIIPSSHNDKLVSTIKAQSFKMERGIWGREINLPIETLIIEDGIKVIEEEAFYNCGLIDVFLPNSIETIGYYAFSENEAEINFPSSIKNLGEYALYGTKLNGNIDLTNVDCDKGALSGTNITAVKFSDSLTEIPESLCYDCPLLTQVDFPSGLITIGKGAFNNCTSLEEIDLPEGLEVIGRQAFLNSGLKEVVLKSGLSEIDSSAFADCEKLEKVVFPNQSFILRERVFESCLKLNDVVFGKSLINIGQAFNYCPLSNMSVALDSDYEIIGGCLAQIINEKYTLVLGYGNFSQFELFNTIGEYAFAGRSFDYLEVGSNIDLIDNYAFYYSNIDEANISSLLVDVSAFEYASLNKLTISSKEIRTHAFYNVNNLIEVIVGEGCEIINQEVFSCCFELEKVTLPASLKAIKKGAFIQCHKLKEVYYDLTSGAPVKMYAGNFIQYISHRTNENGKIDVKINDDFLIFVYSGVYQNCLDTWGDLPVNENFAYSDNLVSRIRLR
ncbi:MAG: leucine-rich repeat domain-containing protein [Bacilli bacterium]